MSVPFWVLGLVSVSLVLMGFAADFGALERDREAASFLAEREQERLLSDWSEIDSYPRLQAWMDDARAAHRGAQLVKWCMTLPPVLDGVSGAPAVRLDFEVDGAEGRLLLRGAAANARARIVAQVPAPAHWPGGWQQSVSETAGPLGGEC